MAQSHPDPNSPDDPSSLVLGDSARRDLAAKLRLRGRHIARRLDAGLKSALGDSRRRLPAFQYLAQVLKRLGESTDSQTADPVHSTQGLDDALVETLVAFNLLRAILADEAAAALGRSPDGREILALTSAISNAGRLEVIARVREAVSKVQTQADARLHWLDLLKHKIHGNLNATLMMLEVLKHDLRDRAEFSDCVGDMDVLIRCIVETVDLLNSAPSPPPP